MVYRFATLTLHLTRFYLPHNPPKPQPTTPLPHEERPLFDGHIFMKRFLRKDCIISFVCGFVFIIGTTIVISCTNFVLPLYPYICCFYVGTVYGPTSSTRVGVSELLELIASFWCWRTSTYEPNT